MYYGNVQWKIVQFKNTYYYYPAIPYGVISSDNSYMSLYDAGPEILIITPREDSIFWYNSYHDISKYQTWGDVALKDLTTGNDIYTWSNSNSTAWQNSNTVCYAGRNYQVHEIGGGGPCINKIAFFRI